MDIYQNNEHILKKSRFSNKSGRLPHKAVELTCMILLRVSWHQYSLLWHTVKNECKWIGNLTPQIFNNLNGIVSRKLQTKHMGLQSKGNNSASQQQVHIARFYVNFVESKHSHLITSQCLQTTENDPPLPPKNVFDGKMETCLKNYKEATPLMTESNCDTYYLSPGGPESEWPGAVEQTEGMHSLVVWASSPPLLWAASFWLVTQIQNGD